MKTLKRTSVLLILVVVITSCFQRGYDLFNALSVQIPESLPIESSDEVRFVNSQNGVTLSFKMTENMQFGEYLPKIDFDLLYNHEVPEGTIIKNREIREMSGLKIGIFEMVDNNVEIKTFFTEVNNEILWGSLKGDISHTKYMDEALNDILKSIKKK